MSGRGMIKWAPFKSLPEQDNFNKTIQKELEKVQKTLILQEKSEKIDEILQKYCGQDVEVSYLVDGQRARIHGKINCINRLERSMWVENTLIKLDDLEDIVDYSNDGFEPDFDFQV